MLSLSAVVAAAEKTKNPLIPAWNELIWGTVAFILLLVVLWRVGVFKRISEALAERTSKIEGQIQQAEAKQAEADRLLDEYRQQLAGAREEANRIVAEAREAAEQLRKDGQQRAQDEANRILESARQEIGAERDRAARELRGEVGHLAVDVAERVIGWQLDEDRQRELIDQFIDELTATGSPNGSGAGSSEGASS
ncbi:MAG TPA: F0F1 ATP synthase subunit B [Actinomycetota bacterium]|nr:F0F1 ATP synthase subunit B [Actinomycetota bacterium]